MTLSGYTYQIGDLFTTSKTGVTGRIVKFSPINSKLTRISLQLANGSRRLAMLSTTKKFISALHAIYSKRSLR